MKIPTAMDYSSVSHHNGGQVGSQIGVSINNKQNDEPNQSVQYSIPGILHFIQHEWARFELERSQWEVDRAEFEARIAFLQGERKGQENLKNDLVRRIKMLEYALKQERAKFHKLKYGVELQQGDVRPPPEEPPAEPEPAEREEVDHEAEEVLNELNSLTESEADSGGQGDEYPVGGGGEADEEPLALGELAQLTVSNEPEAYDVAGANKESFRKTWNAKYTLRSHFDGVKAALVTASEDHTLKLWNLQRTVPAKKSAGLDVEPLYTFRAHSAPVLCLAMGAPRSEECFSGGLDGTIRHTDAVWSLSCAHGRLLSASADGTARLWAPRAARPLLATLRDELHGTAACAADFAEGGARAAGVLRVSCDSPATRVRAHPTLPLLVSAHEDRHIRFWDTVSGRCAHAMVAHLDAVTGLALDPNGLFLLSGSHDCSVRLWNLDTKTCVQEITAHRKKFDESILDVAFHPLRPYIASAGADGLAKVFV
ncbi:hypothetical protein MSG28_006366 [Choristoneura fumiferana]|nr:hypothetical protein MSG28_006366 [Choristoneura fumiferana]KAI8422572.1 hypothetical protein MSG28_006366 [Choristoneura fumiferana]